MATTARFAAGGSSSPPTPAPATTPPAQPQQTQLIVLPASLHQVRTALLPVIDHFEALWAVKRKKVQVSRYYEYYGQLGSVYWTYLAKSEFVMF